MRLTNMITAIDLHACGESGRVITGGVLDVPGRTMFEKMKYFKRLCAVPGAGIPLKNAAGDGGLSLTLRCNIR